MRFAVVFALVSTLQTSATALHAEQQPDPEVALQGILTGDSRLDDKLVQAFQRGYQRGVLDAQRQCKANEARLLASCKKR